MLVEDDRTHVWRINDHVDDRKLGVRIVSSHFGERSCPGEACHHDWIVACFGKAADRLLTLCVGLDLNLGIRAASFLCPTFGTIVGAFVEGFVELAAKVEEDGGVCRRSTGSECQRSRRAKEFLHKCHWLISQVVLCGVM